jgi:hypothetical protein
LCKKFPILFELALNKECLVSEVTTAEWVIKFKIRLPPLIRDQWYNLTTQLNEVSLNDSKKKVIWKWSPSSRQFTVRSVYLHLTRDENGVAYKEIWKAKIPLKIRSLCGWCLKVPY